MPALRDHAKSCFSACRYSSDVYEEKAPLLPRGINSSMHILHLFIAIH